MEKIWTSPQGKIVQKHFLLLYLCRTVNELRECALNFMLEFLSERFSKISYVTVLLRCILQVVYKMFLGNLVRTRA